MPTSNTENHGFRTPSLGDGDWHEELDKNRQDYDKKIPIVDTDSNTSNYTAFEDAFYFAYDTGKVYRGDGSSWVEKTVSSIGDHASDHEDGGSDELEADNLAGANGSADQFLQTDGSASSWATPSASDISDVSADSAADAHHTDPTAGTGVTDEGTNQFGLDVIKSGSTTLSSGSATVDTGVGSGNTATFFVALGPDTDDADVAADVRAASGSNYEVDIEETDTSVGNPTIRYDIVRVR